MHTFQTSLRSRSASETWQRLAPHRERFGVTRVTNTTLLDRVGMPVYAAIRPDARKGSVCVSSGKALTQIEAKLGALCEAIELQLAQFDPRRHRVSDVTVAAFQAQFSLDIYDFCVLAPHIQKIADDDRLSVTAAVEYSSGREYLLPASLIFVPYPERRAFFSQSSNGLAGGNTLEEALLHAIFEVIERDTLSFARTLSLESSVSDIQNAAFAEVAGKIRDAGLSLYVTVCPNPFQLPMFICYLFDPGVAGTVSVARGQGLHFDRDIALLRAVTEAVQSRLTNIHGGRDDIVRRFEAYEGPSLKREVQQCRNLEARLRKAPAVSFQRVPAQPLLPTIKENLDHLVALLETHGFPYVFYRDLSAPEVPELTVVKVVIPGLECYSRDFPRVGKRLLKAFGH